MEAGPSSAGSGGPGSASTMEVCRRKKVPPPRKCNQPERLPLFFKNFEKYAAAEYGDDLDSWLLILPDFVEGRILKVVQAFGEDKEYGDVKERLLKDFVQKEIVTGNLYQDILDLRREPNEDLRCFTIRLEGLAAKLGSDEEGKNALIMNALEKNVPVEILKEIKKQRCMAEETTIDDFVMLSEELMKIFNISDGGGDHKVRIVTRSENTEPVADFPMERGACFNCGVFGHFSRDCSKGKKTNSVKCYKCGGQGHIARNCREGNNSAREEKRERQLPICGFCGVYGHCMIRCREFRQFQDGQAPKGSTGRYDGCNTRGFSSRKDSFDNGN